MQIVSDPDLVTNITSMQVPCRGGLVCRSCSTPDLGQYRKAEANCMTGRQRQAAGALTSNCAS